MIDYPFNPIIAYYGKRPTFVWTRYTPEAYRRAALERAKYAVVTPPAPAVGGVLALVNRLRHSSHSPEPTDWLETSGFHMFVTEKGFVVYRKN